MENEVNKLNSEQKKAIESTGGPLLIIAGPGTGKTHVLVEKVKYLIKTGLVKPDGILALTFTEKAATEMETRIDEIMPYGYFQMWISTFHAFADRILKEESTHFGLTPGYRLMTEAESIIFLRQRLFMLNLDYYRPLSHPEKFIKALLAHFSRLKDENITPEEYKKWAEAEKEESIKYLELARAYDLYQRLKMKEGVVDFSDLVYYLIRLFQKRPNLIKKYRQQFTYILVDEFQDTNISQYELIKMLCPANQHPNLTVVGDDSQAIYKFRGASVSNILSFINDYPDTKQVTLNINYRSNQTILDSSYKLIKYNDPDTLEAKMGISKNLFSVKKNRNNAIRFYHGNSIEDEAEFIADKIVALRTKYKYSEMAILVRANNHTEPFMRTLSRRGIPYQFIGPGMLFKQPEIKDLIAYIKFLSDIDDSVSFYRVISMDILDIDSQDISLLLSFSKKINRSLYQTIEIFLSFYHQEISRPEFEIYKQYLPLITEKSRIKLFEVYKMVKRHLDLIRKETAGQIIYFFLEDVGYLSKLVKYKTEKEEKIALNISKFFSILKSFENEYKDASVFVANDFLDMSMELGESPISVQTDIPNFNAVNILTVHSSKGLEFPVVFIVNLTHGRFPTREKKEIIPIPQALIKEILPVGDYHLEEERRLFYVALTRAKDMIYLTSAQYYGEGKRQQKISPFVPEALGTLYIKEEKKQTKQKNHLTMLDYKKEKEKIDEFSLFKSGSVSFSQLETYKLCPLRYKYQYVLRIPISPTSSLTFGQTIHKTLQEFYQRFRNEKKIKKRDLLKIYDKQWIPLGYSSKIHEKKMKEEGKILLGNYYDKYHRTNLEILDIEKQFKIKIDGISIIGKIDRIDKISNNSIEIIDYKTGKKPNEKNILSNLQLSIYSLAAMDKGIYNKKLAEINLTFNFLRSGDSLTVKPTDNQLRKVKEEVKEMVGLIKSNKFSPKVGPWCSHCPFRIICEAWQ